MFGEKFTVEVCKFVDDRERMCDDDQTTLVHNTFNSKRCTWSAQTFLHQIYWAITVEKT